MSTESTVFVVEDDEQIRRPLALLLRGADFKTAEFADAESFLSSYSGQPGCVILDVRLNGSMGGLELQEDLLNRGFVIPVIFMSAFANIPMAVRAMRLGAKGIFEKPLNEDELIAAVRTAVEADENDFERRRQITRNLARLSMREREVLRYLLEPRDIKHIARTLGISPKTAEKHRTSLLGKMSVDSVPELICRLRPYDDLFVTALLAASPVGAR
ncbi:MAG TPA: response regulator [Pirellulales bacterium]|jgi:FixJ family two-component response regulator|nr:response regulator [Pirellulales bacterium]